MAGNQLPIFSKRGAIAFNSYMVTGNTTVDLTSGTTYLVFTADSVNGSFVQRIRFRSTPGGTTTATVARIWLNNGATTGTATNNILFDEITLPSTTASASTATGGIELPLGFALPAGWRIYITIGTSSANGWAATTVAGDY